MKNLKRIFSVFLTLILAFCAVSTVSAAGAGKITVSGATEGKTYEIYKIFDLTYSGSNVAYTIDSDWTAFFNGDGAEYIVNENNAERTLNPITIGDEVKYINITEANKIEFSKKALAYITKAEAQIAADKTGTTAEGATTVEFTGLDLGYYLVYPKGAADLKEGELTICTLTSTLPEITVNVKATYPGITKTANDESVDVGQLVEFTIGGKVPTTTGYSKYIYKISDTWTGGLELPTEGFDFTVKFGTTVINVAPTTTASGFTLEFDMTEYQQYAGQNITVTYNLRVTEDAIKVGTNNSATLEYSNNPKNGDETEVTPPVVVKLYSSEIIIDKFETGSESTKLAGAQFILTKVNTEGKTVYYQAVNANGVITSTEENPVYTTTGLTKVNWVEDKALATVLTTNDQGKIEFKGIENGSYQLIETKAPEGYNLLSKPENVVLEAEETAETKSVSLISKIANSTGKELPVTGGMGTKLFIGIGSLLAIVSAIILVTNKRMAKEY